jgi:hypothetical protein
MPPGSARSGTAVVGAVCVTVAAGCSAAATPAVTVTAEGFGRALARHDGSAACAMLTDNARSATESFGRDCATQLATLPDPGPVQQVEVWSDAARVRFAADTVFLLRFPDGWRVGAAACSPRGDAPYDCQVQG